MSRGIKQQKKGSRTNSRSRGNLCEPHYCRCNTTGKIRAYTMALRRKISLFIACLLPMASTFTLGFSPSVCTPKLRQAGRSCTITCQANDISVSRRELGALLSGLVVTTSKPSFAAEPAIPPGQIFTDPQGEVGIPTKAMAFTKSQKSHMPKRNQHTWGFLV